MNSLSLCLSSLSWGWGGVTLPWNSTTKPDAQKESERSRGSPAHRQPGEVSVTLCAYTKARSNVSAHLNTYFQRRSGISFLLVTGELVISWIFETGVQEHKIRPYTHRVWGDSPCRNFLQVFHLNSAVTHPSWEKACPGFLLVFCRLWGTKPCGVHTVLFSPAF